MKPKIKEVSQVLRIYEDGLCIRKTRAGSGVRREEIRAAIGVKIPKNWEKYVVTFKISQRGSLMVGHDEYQNRSIPTILRYKRTRAAYFACFLPNDWVGYRVTRFMKVLKEAA
jgi:hypothetical protein